MALNFCLKLESLKMKNKWYINWLVVITVFLFFTTLSLFVLSVQDTIGIKKCAYGDIVFDGTKNCVCDSKGKLKCDTDGLQSIKSEEFTTDHLSFQSEFLNYIESGDSILQGVEFDDISQVGNTLRIRLEKQTLCNDRGLVAPEVGFYKEEENSLILTIGTNLVDESYSIPCISENTFAISNLRVKYSDDYKILYQDVFDSLLPAGNCVYEGFLRNTGDVYNSSDNCYLCTCKLGQNVCEKEPKCSK
jgi:hypothetical protein